MGITSFGDLHICEVHTKQGHTSTHSSPFINCQLSLLNPNGLTSRLKQLSKPQWFVRNNRQINDKILSAYRRKQLKYNRADNLAIGESMHLLITV